MYCLQYLRPEPGEALVWSSPWGSSVLRYGRDEPCWSLFPSVFRVPTSSQSGDVISLRALTNDAISVSLTGRLRFAVSSQTDSMILDMAERFWSLGNEGLMKLVLELAASIQASVLGEFTVMDLRSTEGMAHFVSKLKIILERELEPMGLEVQGYYVKEIMDHVGYLNALDAIQIASIVKESRINTAEKTLENAITEAEFKAHEFQRSLNEKKNEFLRDKPPELRKLRSVIEEEIHRANVEYGKELQATILRKKLFGENYSAKVQALREEVNSELENYVEKVQQELEDEVRTPALKCKEELENEARLKSEEVITEARKNARHIVLESERAALRINAQTEKSLETIRMAAEILKDYPLRDFINDLQSFVEKDGILKSFVDLICNLLKDFDDRRQLKITTPVPKKEIADEETKLLDFNEHQAVLPLPIALSMN